MAALLAGCSSPVAVPPPSPSPTGEAAAACAALGPRLPWLLEGQKRRPTEPDSDLAWAWADPPLVLRCGVPVPSALEPTSELLSIEGVDWLAEELSAGYRFSTVGRVATVEVTVPDAYSPEVNPLVDLAPAITATVPLQTP